jgi:hypothetical protein
MVFYYHMIYSPETDRQVRHCSQLQSLRIQQINTYNDIYSVHDDVLMSCRACLLRLLASYEHLPASTAGYQLLIPPPAGGLGPLLPPYSWRPHFPQGPRTLLSLCPLQIHRPKYKTDFLECVGLSPMEEKSPTYSRN